jgi:hypothetical protein
MDYAPSEDASVVAADDQIDRERIVIMDSDSDSESVRGIDRRRLVRWGGSAAAGVVAAGVPLV